MSGVLSIVKRLTTKDIDKQVIKKDAFKWRPDLPNFNLAKGDDGIEVNLAKGEFDPVLSGPEWDKDVTLTQKRLPRFYS